MVPSTKPYTLVTNPFSVTSLINASTITPGCIESIDEIVETVVFLAEIVAVVGFKLIVLPDGFEAIEHKITKPEQ